VVILGVAARLLFAIHLDSELPLEGLYVDERVYADGADALTEGGFERPPGMYLLADLLGASGNPLTARIAISVLSLLPAIALALMLPDRVWPMLASVAVALDPYLVLFGMQILPAVPACLLILATILLMRRERFGLCGLTLGLACLFRSEIAVLVLLLPIWGLLARRNLAGFLRSSAVAVVVLLPVLSVNLSSKAGPVVSKNAGENLWLGTSPELVEVPPGLEFEELVAVRGEEGRQGYFLRLALGTIRERPLEWIGFGFLKALRSLTVPGPGRNLEVGYLFRGTWMSILLVPFLLFLSLGYARIRLTGDPWRLLSFCCLLAIPLMAILFFPAARYRLAFLPGAWMLAAVEAPRPRQLPAAGLILLVLLALSLAVSWPPATRDGLTQILRAERELDSGHPAAALETLRKGARERGYRGADLANLSGIALMRMGRDREGVDMFKNAVRQAQSSPTAWKNLAVALLSSGDRGAAADAAARAVSLDPALEEDLAPLIETEDEP
jgi:hypothetical protein